MFLSFIEGSNMEDIDTLKAQVKKLNVQATQLKMDLHDLSEELPVNWENILELAARTYGAYKALADARARLNLGKQLTAERR
jgi:hypothetical protein